MGRCPSVSHMWVKTADFMVNFPRFQAYSFKSNWCVAICVGNLLDALRQNKSLKFCPVQQLFLKKVINDSIQFVRTMEVSYLMCFTLILFVVHTFTFLPLWFLGSQSSLLWNHIFSFALLFPLGSTTFSGFMLVLAAGYNCKYLDKDLQLLKVCLSRRLQSNWKLLNRFISESYEDMRT